jgi:hypothetical protein
MPQCLAGSGGSGGSSSVGNSGAPAVTSWDGPVAVHRAPRAQRSRFVAALEEEPDEATAASQTAEAADAFQEALEQAARHASA